MKVLIRFQREIRSAGFPGLLLAAVGLTGASGAELPPGCRAPSGAQAELAGVIEIGSSGIKPVVFEVTLDDSVSTESAVSQDRRPSLTQLCVYPTYDTRIASPANINVASEKAAEYLARIDADYGLPPEKVYIVASSGVAQLDNFDKQIRRAVAKKTNRDPRDIGAVSANQECSYSLQWMAPDSPHGEVVLVDIGSGNTKGCDSRDGWQALKWGAKSAEQMIKLNLRHSRDGTLPELNSCRNQGAEDDLRVFACAADRARKKEFADLYMPTQSNPGRVFLIGGAPWAAVTYLQPGAAPAGEKVQLTPADIGAVRNRAVTGHLDVYRTEARYLALDENQRQIADSEASRAVGKENSVFSAPQFIAGLDIIGAFMDKYASGPNASVFEFAAGGLSAWSSSYLREKLWQEKSGEKTANLISGKPASDAFQTIYTAATRAHASERYGQACIKYKKALATLGDDESTGQRKTATEIRLMEIRQTLEQSGEEVEACD